MNTYRLLGFKDGVAEIEIQNPDKGKVYTSFIGPAVERQALRNYLTDLHRLPLDSKVVVHFSPRKNIDIKERDLLGIELPLFIREEGY